MYFSKKIRLDILCVLCKFFIVGVFWGFMPHHRMMPGEYSFSVFRMCVCGYVRTNVRPSVRMCVRTYVRT